MLSQRGTEGTMAKPSAFPLPFNYNLFFKMSSLPVYPKPVLSSYSHVLLSAKFCLLLFSLLLLLFLRENLYLFCSLQTGAESQPGPSPASLCWRSLGFLRSEYANSFLGCRPGTVIDRG